MIADEETLTPLQSRFRLCIASGVTIPSSTSGLYACAADDYKVFWPVFSRVLAQWHGLGPDYATPMEPYWPTPVRAGSQIHVRGIGEKFETEEAMVEIFAQFGTVSQVQIRHRIDEDTGANTSWALVTMDSRDAAEAAIASADRLPYLPSPVTVTRFSKKQASSSAGHMGAIRGEADFRPEEEGEQEEEEEELDELGNPVPKKEKPKHRGPLEHCFGSHGWDLTTINRDFLTDVPEDFDLDLGLLTPLAIPSMPIRLSCARNLKAFNLVSTMTQDERTTVEDLLGHTIMMLIERPEWRGRYVSLTPGHPNEIQASEHEGLAAEGLMFPAATTNAEMEAGGLTADWPYGRGCWISQDERTTIWIGNEDHLLINAGGSSEHDVDVLLDQLAVMLEIVEDTEKGIEFQFDARYSGYVTSSIKRAGTGMVASAKLKLPKMTIDGSADRVREVIKEKKLDMQIVVEDKAVSQGFEKLSSMGAGLLSSDDVASGGEVHLEVKRTYMVTEAHIAASLYCGLKAIWEAEQEEQVLFGCSDNFIGKYIAQAFGQAQRQTKMAQSIAQEATDRAVRMAEDAARLAEEQARKAQESAMAAAQASIEAAEAAAKKSLEMAEKAAVESQRMAEEAAKKSLEMAENAAAEAQKQAMAGVDAVKNAALEANELAKSSLEAGKNFKGKLASGMTSPGKEDGVLSQHSPHSPHSPPGAMGALGGLAGGLTGGLGAGMGDMEDMFGDSNVVPDLLKYEDPLAIEIDVIPIDTELLNFKNAHEIELLTIKAAAPSEKNVTTSDGVERYGVTLTVFDEAGLNTMGLDTKAGHVKKGGAVEERFEFLLPTEEERNEWLDAVRAAMPEVEGSVYTGEAKQGRIFMQNRRYKWKERHCTLSASGFVSSDSMEGTIRMKLVADSQEEKAAWIVALKWLEKNCEGPPPRKDPRMYPGGIPARPLTSFEWSKMNANVGLLDLPLSSTRSFLQLLQEQGKLGVTQAFNRDFVRETTSNWDPPHHTLFSGDVE